jgi:hypothetical protein
MTRRFKIIIDLVMLYSDTNQKVIDSSKQNKGTQKKDECG